MTEGTVLGQAAPVTGDQRHLSMDVVRGVALFGILLMNIMGFGYHVSPAEFVGTEPWSGANFWTWYIPFTFFEGTQRGLFSLLFGAGVVLLTSRLEGRDNGLSAADVYYRRNIWLIGWGMVNSYLFLWDGDILYSYGLVALFLYPLRNVRPSRLLAVGVVSLAILTAVHMYDASEDREKYAKYQEAVAVRDAGEELDEEQQEAIDGWEEYGREYFADEELIQERIDAHRDGYFTTFMHHVPDLTFIHGNFMYKYLFLDVIGFMAIGMALFKWGVMTLQAPVRVYWLLLLVGYGIGIPLRLFLSQDMISNDWALIAWSNNAFTWEFSRLIMTAGHLGLLLLFVRSGILGWFQRSLAAAGRMALTNYLMHSLLALVIFLRPGFGLYGALERYELYYVVAGICLFQLILSPIWLKYFRFGPAEWVWRSLTYMKRPEFRRR